MARGGWVTGETVAGAGVREALRRAAQWPGGGRGVTEMREGWDP